MSTKSDVCELVRLIHIVTLSLNHWQIHGVPKAATWSNERGREQEEQVLVKVLHR